MTLSERQQNMLEFIITFYRESEYPPTIREIGEKCGISSTSVVNYNLTRLEDLELVTRREKVSRGLALNWPKLVEMDFVSETDVPHMTQSNGERHQERKLPTLEEVTHLVRLPVLGYIAAGEPIPSVPSEAQNPMEWVEVAEPALGSNRPTEENPLYALRVQGDSMLDASIRDGDIVILRQQQRAETGEMVAAWIDGDEETTLKYFYPEGNKIRLQPDNQAYDPIIRDADKVQVMGRVVSVIRYYQ